MSQKPETLEFWNDFYTNQQEQRNDTDAAREAFMSSKEWIVHPNSALLEKLFGSTYGHHHLEEVTETEKHDNDVDDEHLPFCYCHDNKEKTLLASSCLRILEVGCGTSTLSRDVYLYLCRQRERELQEQQQHFKSHAASDHENGAILTTSSTAALDGRRIHVLATDASPVCIEQMKRRDRQWLSSSLSNDYSDDQHQHDNQDVDNNNEGLEYRVLNLTEPQPNFMEQFDYILDKGCLDTFLFRSRKRGGGRTFGCRSHSNNSNITVPSELNGGGTNTTTCRGCGSGAYHSSSPLVHLVLDHISSWLRPGSGRYLILSPRSKLREVRDYPEFASVVRHALDDPSLFSIAALDGKPKAAVASSSSSSNHNQKDKSKKEDDTTFLYECIKREQKSSLTKQRLGEEDNDNSNRSYDNNPRQEPTDQSNCPNCSMTFLDYRKGETLEGRGSYVWYRRWYGHIQHCRSSTALTLSSQDGGG